MDKLLPYYQMVAQFWNDNQVVLVLAVILLCIAVMLITIAKSGWTMWRRRKRKKPITLFDWLDLVSSKLVQSMKDQENDSYIIEMSNQDGDAKVGTDAMLLDTKVRVWTTKQVKTMFGDVVHGLVQEAVRTKKLSGAEARVFLEFAAFRLGDLELMPPKLEVPIPSPLTLKSAIRGRLKQLKGTKKPNIPDENSVHVEAGVDMLKALKRRSKAA